MGESFFTRYRKYLRNNPQGYWFLRKPFGWGWTPARWQGWATLAVFVLAVFVDLLWFSGREGTDAAGTQVKALAVAAVLALLLVLVCYRTGPKPRWQWGFGELRD